VKKGRHRRFEEARALKRNTDMLDDDEEEEAPVPGEPCPECGRTGTEHASWCLHEEDEATEEDDAWS
jgi:hypothetical protein